MYLLDVEHTIPGTLLADRATRRFAVEAPDDQCAEAAALAQARDVGLDPVRVWGL